MEKRQKDVPSGDRSSSWYEQELAKIGHIADLNRPWEEVLPMAVKVTYPKGAVIPHLSTPGMCYLSKGSVVIAYSSSCGRERLALYIQPGCLFNEARTVSMHEPGGRFVCTDSVELYRFPKNLLDDIDFIRQYPHLIANLLRSMGMKILIHYSFLASMGVGSHVVHLCRFILSLARKNHEKHVFPSGMTQQEVADLLGVHRATLARAVHSLKELGVITRFTSREVRIGDWDMMVRLAEQ